MSHTNTSGANQADEPVTAAEMVKFHRKLHWLHVISIVNIVFFMLHFSLLVMFVSENIDLHQVVQEQKERIEVLEEVPVGN